MLSPSAQQLVAQAISLRDTSVAAVEPALEGVPEQVPQNVLVVPEMVLTPEELQITSYDAPELLKLMREKALTCEVVTRAFLRRAALAQKMVCFGYV